VEWPDRRLASDVGRAHRAPRRRFAKNAEGALALADRRLLLWSWDNTFQLWDGQSGACLETVSEDVAAIRHPDWVQARMKAQHARSIFRDFFVRALNRSVHLRYKVIASVLATWNAESDSIAPCLMPDGTAVVTQANGQVCILKLHHGNRRISSPRRKTLLTLQRKKAE